MGKKKKQKVAPRPQTGAMDVVLAAVSIINLAGLRMFVQPCTHADGSEPACRLTATVLLVLAVVAVGLVVLRQLGADTRTKRSFDFLLLIVGVLYAVLPGNVLGLCSDASMVCHVVMLPFARVVGVALGLAAVACEATVDQEVVTGRKRRR